MKYKRGAFELSTPEGVKVKDFEDAITYIEKIIESRREFFEGDGIPAQLRDICANAWQESATGKNDIRNGWDSVIVALAFTDGLSGMLKDVRDRFPKVPDFK